MTRRTRSGVRSRGKRKRRQLKPKCAKRRTQRGLGILNWVINKLPFELHLPFYNYCGPGTRLQKRLAAGDQGVNELDELCKQHDISYEKYKNVAERNEADKTLLDGALKLIKSNKNGVGLLQRTLARGVAGVMRLKLKYGV